MRLNPILFILVTLSALLGAIGSAVAGDGPLTVAMYSGSGEYKSAETLPAFKTFLEAGWPVKATVHQMGKNDTLVGIDDLATCDVAVIFVKRMNLSEEQLTKIKAFCASGKGIVGIRTASHAFQSWLDFDKEVLGGSYKGHAGDKLAQCTFPDAAKDHPVLAGVKPFTTMGKLYSNQANAADVTVLVNAATDNNKQPVAWARDYKGAHVFYTSLGVKDDFSNEDFKRMMVNAVFWAGKRTPVAKTP